MKLCFFLLWMGDGGGGGVAAPVLYVSSLCVSPTCCAFAVTALCSINFF